MVGSVYSTAAGRKPLMARMRVCRACTTSVGVMLSSRMRKNSPAAVSSCVVVMVGSRFQVGGVSDVASTPRRRKRTSGAVRTRPGGWSGVCARRMPPQPGGGGSWRKCVGRGCGGHPKRDRVGGVPLSGLVVLDYGGAEGYEHFRAVRLAQEFPYVEGAARR